MFDHGYSEEIRAQLRTHPGRRGERHHDRDVARLLSPWRRHRGWPDPVTWGE